jgi:2-polyprenyl-3-methyl-5-hydroxy-6-metoxy-1,4-benzoquinol methylase
MQCWTKACSGPQAETESDDIVEQEETMNAITMEPYVLGHSDTELRRLALQSAFWGELTEDVFRRAGIGAGMNVLDIGCGAGDVAFIAARLVGPSGSVLGIDRSADAVRRAAARAAEQGLGQCCFGVADVNAYDTERRFDAIVGRLVLMHLPDPVRTLRALRLRLKPGGLMVFHEIVLSAMRSVPPVPLFSRGGQWVIDAFERAGAEVDMGLKLHATLRAAGLQPAEPYAASRPIAGPDSAGYAVLTAVVRALLPAIEKFGIATAAEVDIDTFADRLRDATVAADACVLSPVLVGAWARSES